MPQDITGNAGGVNLAQPVVLQIPSPAEPAKAGATVGSGPTAQVGLMTILQRLIDFIKALIDRTDTMQTNLSAVIAANSDDDGNIANVQGNLTAHIGSSAAHAAANLSYAGNVPSGAAAGTVETALDDLAARATALEIGGVTQITFNAAEYNGSSSGQIGRIPVIVPNGKRLTITKIRSSLVNYTGTQNFVSFLSADWESILPGDTNAIIGLSQSTPGGFGTERSLPFSGSTPSTSINTSGADRVVMLNWSFLSSAAFTVEGLTLWVAFIIE
jgi:hypothetical protein